MVYRWVEEGVPSSHSLDTKPKYVRAIGMVSLEAIAMELRLATLLARTIGVSTRTAQAIYLTPKAEQTRIEIFRNAAKARLHVSPSKQNTLQGRKQARALQDVMKIIAEAEKLIRQRHRVIHDEWNFSDTEKRVVRRIVDGQVGRERVPVSLKDLTTLIHGMRVVIDNAHTLSQEFKESPPFMADLRNASTNSGS